MSQNDIISLSSDEEETPPPRKRIKLSSLPLVIRKITTKADCTPSTSKLVKPVTLIVSSDDEDEQSAKTSSVAETVETADAPTVKPNMVKETQEVDPQPVSEIVENGISDHDHADISKLFKDFLNSCTCNIRIPEHRAAVDDKLQFMQDAFDKYLQLTDDFSSFEHSLGCYLQNVTDHPKRALVYFTDVYQLLKSKLRDVTQAKQAIKGKEKIIKKLERVLAKLKKKIDDLDEAEVNFDDEENSSYLQVARYKQRAAEIHAKLCKYRKVNPYSGRITHQRLKFTHSKHPEINEAINKKYKNNTTFPTYLDVQKLIKNLQTEMSDIEIQIEAKRCFEKLGNFIQRQRRLELYALHADHLIDTFDDPAKDNPALQGELLQSYQVKVEKENKIFDKFSEMQDKGMKCDDSEEGSVADSDSDNEKNGNEANDNKIDECITID